MTKVGPNHGPYVEERKKCPYDPRELAGAPIGQYHCPECGEMVLAGMEHPDWGLLSDIEFLNERGVHINTRDEQGIIQPLSGETIHAIAELVRAFDRTKESREDAST